MLLNQPEKFDPVALGWNDFRLLCLRLQCRPIKAHNMTGVKLDERGLMVLCSLNSSKLLKSLFQIVLVLHDVPARAFLYKVFGKVSTLLFCFIKDSAASQAELIFWNLVTHVVSIDSVACRSRSRISAIFCSAACETSRSASWELSRSSETVW